MKIYLLIFLSLISLIGCDIFDEHEDPPVYIEINEISVLDPNSKEKLTHDIREVWCYFEGEVLGVFPIPAIIPCLPTSENSEIILFPGIRENGIANSISTYPMLKEFNFQAALVPGEPLVLNPEFEYRNDIFLRLDESFESSSHVFTFDADNLEDSKLITTSLNSASGSYSGSLEVLPSSFAEVASNPVISAVPVDGSAVFLELDYKSNADLFIGLIGYEDALGASQSLSTYYLGLKPSEEWTKIYVNLTSEFFKSGLKAYRVLLRVEHAGSNSNEHLYIDNVKLLHF